MHRPRRAVEINGNPWRLELDWRWHRKAVTFGCMLSMNPEAHSMAELDLVKWGVAVARKGGVAQENVLNSMSLEEIMQHLQGRAVSRSAHVQRARRKINSFAH